MPDHNVTLHYTKNPDPNGKPLFKPEPNPIFVKKNQSIGFKLGDDSIPGTIHITFPHKQIFSKAEVRGNGEVHVTGAPIPTTYRCQLLGPDGKTIAESNEGGDILPDPGGAV